MKGDLTPIPRCLYRHCVHILISKRSDAKYCSRICKQYERIYRKREDKSFKSDKDQINQILKNWDSLNSPEIMGLYNKINNK